ncbi:hypothetical protein E3T37_00220 [Cryobacterium sp. TMT2-10]|uniref:hypothetical protein n=1 Tax=Cryobacterium sp. TMT2-10 TaxID=1259244 RepID=UPI00106D9026|nr:hypothetical protein [Cryobacterium sp. TMT2-10]TFD44231.1 hypothetical protein E3T37_00220 [Cryobacterium sp. TMT2-10]
MGDFGRRSSVIAVVVLVCGALFGCTNTTGGATAQSPSSDDRAVGGGPAKGIVASATPAPPEAVVVVAGVDVDGAHVSASGYLAGVVESGGECTFVFVQGDSTVKSSSESAVDRMSTSCGTVQVPIGGFSRGRWTVSLEYKSTNVATTSQPMNLEIP